MKAAKRFINVTLVIILAFAIALVVVQDIVFAHCDTLDGPVAIEAAAALEKGDVTPVLKWVKKEYEEDIKAVFRKVLTVRAKGSEAQEIADKYFLETLIRLHREGEGAPFTGLKPAGTIEPSVAAADNAIEAGSADALAKKIGQAAEQAIRERFARLMEAKTHKDESVEAGREYVEAYVTYVHFIEKLHNTIMQQETHGIHTDTKSQQGRSH